MQEFPYFFALPCTYLLALGGALKSGNLAKEMPNVSVVRVLKDDSQLCSGVSHVVVAH